MSAPPLSVSRPPEMFHPAEPSFTIASTSYVNNCSVTDCCVRSLMTVIEIGSCTRPRCPGARPEAPVPSPLPFTGLIPTPFTEPVSANRVAPPTLSDALPCAPALAYDEPCGSGTAAGVSSHTLLIVVL